MVVKDQNTRDHSAWTIETEIPCTRCVSHTGYLAHGNSEGEARGRNRHENNSNRVARNLEEKNVGTKAKSPKQGPTSAKDLTIELPEGDKTFPKVCRIKQASNIVINTSSA